MALIFVDGQHPEVDHETSPPILNVSISTMGGRVGQISSGTRAIEERGNLGKRYW